MVRVGTAITAGKTVIELSHNVHTFTGAASEFRSADKAEFGRKAGRAAFTEGADTGKSIAKGWLKAFEVIPRLVCRGLQFLFAIIACGIYGHHIDAHSTDQNGFSPEWVLAVIVAGVAAITAVVFAAATPLAAAPVIGSKLKVLKVYRAFGWDFILFVAWIVVFGVFASIFLKRTTDTFEGSSTGPMKAAVWLDFVNALLWLISGVYGSIKTFMGDKVDQMTDKATDKLFTKRNAQQAKEADCGV